MTRMNTNSNNFVHRTVGGIPFSMEKLRNLNANSRALGNANLNARGDKLDSSGRVIRRREDMVNDYYQRKTDGVKYVSLSSMDIDNINTIPSVTNMETKAPETEFRTITQIQNNIDKPDNIRRKKKLIDEE